VARFCAPARRQFALSGHQATTGHLACGRGRSDGLGRKKPAGDNRQWPKWGHEDQFRPPSLNCRCRLGGTDLRRDGRQGGRCAESGCVPGTL